MILLPFSPTTSTDPLLRAGSDAEKQMAFYLDRELKSSPDVMIFHGLRMALPPGHGASNEDHFQIDHLVVSRECSVLIESKSVSSTVRVNEHDEWSRVWNGRWTGIPSPVKQVERQRDALRRTLTVRRAEFLPKFLGLQTGIAHYNIDVAIALSDRAMFERPKRWEADNVMKAEAIVEHVRERIRQLKIDGFALGILRPTSDVVKVLSDDSFAKLCALLKQSHEPLPQVKSAMNDDEAKTSTQEQRSAAVAVTVPVDGNSRELMIAPRAQIHATCRHCSNSKVQIVHAAYGYCFKCDACSKFTPIDFSCGDCGTKGRIRKQGLQFFKACQKCNAEKLFWTNPA